MKNTVNRPTNIYQNISKSNESKQHSDKFDMKPGDGVFFKNETELEAYLKKHEPNRKFVN